MDFNSIYDAALLKKSFFEFSFIHSFIHILVNAFKQLIFSYLSVGDVVGYWNFHMNIAI